LELKDLLPLTRDLAPHAFNLGPDEFDVERVRLSDSKAATGTVLIRTLAEGN
jgi:hypothetical protein